jgi:hypothetical protein
MKSYFAAHLILLLPEKKVWQLCKNNCTVYVSTTDLKLRLTAHPSVQRQETETTER